MKRPVKKAAKKSAAPVIDPYLPDNGNFGYRVSRYELDLEYKVADQPADRNRHHHRGDTGVAEDVHPRSVRRAVGHQGDGQRQAPGTLPHRQPQAAHHARRPTAGRRGDGDRGSLRRITRGRSEPYWGEVGFEELSNGALVAGQPNGAASWFPCDDHPSAKASYRIQISTDSPYRAIANGELVSRRVRAGTDRVDL